jgi:hypothetical protein
MFPEVPQRFPECSLSRSSGTGKWAQGAGVQEQETFSEHLGNIQGIFSEHIGNIQGIFSKHLGNIQGIFSEHSDAWAQGQLGS